MDWCVVSGSQRLASRGSEYSLCVGDASLEKEAALVSDSSSFPTASLVDIVVATPGRLAEHLMLGSFASLQFLRSPSSPVTVTECGGTQYFSSDSWSLTRPISC